MKKILLFIALSLSIGLNGAFAQKKHKIIAYYTGNGEQIQQYEIEKITHIIYSFAKLQNDSLILRDSDQEATVKQLVALKSKHPQLKIMISMGGWSGCASCSNLFAEDHHRKNFAKTTALLLNKYNLDGIDLDWEYPGIEGFPGHKFTIADKDNFTKLLLSLRQELRKDKLLTFAAGGFVKYLEQSIDWQAVTPLVDFINLMTYDLVGGYATTTGHHTPLYSYRNGQESTNRCVQWLRKNNVPANKLVIGTAMYARVWEKVPNITNGLYQSGIFKEGVRYAKFAEYFSDSAGYKYHWDKQAKAPYAYSSKKRLFATFDDKSSIKAKTKYVRNQGLAGVMFWELIEDSPTNGLLNEIYHGLETQ